MRRLELDSLRGIAALIVLTYHSLAINILVFAQGSQSQKIEPIWGNLLAYTPLRIFWSGGEAVWVFFVLSGFVLSTAAGAKSFKWGAYFPSRLIRLYVPVAIAILITLISIRFIPHVITQENKEFLGGAAVGYPWSSVINDLLVIPGPTNTLGPLWSLKWEILFSLLLPAYLFASKTRRNTWLIVAIAGMFAGFWLTNEFLMYMPMFYIGVWLATFNFVDISNKFSAKFDSVYLQTLICMIWIIVSITLITSFWIWGNQYSQAAFFGIPASPFFAIIKVLGISLLMVAVLTFPRVKLMLSHKAAVFMGTISFSLYLVHWPIVITAAFLIGPGWPSAVAGFVTSIVFSIFFYYAIEARAHNLSRNVAKDINQQNNNLAGYPL